MKYRVGIPNFGSNWAALDSWLAENGEWTAATGGIRDIGGPLCQWRAVETDDRDIALLVKMRFGRCYRVVP
jgi:hypothetical protein